VPQPSATARFLASLVTLVTPLFIACTVLVLLVWGFGIGDGVLASPRFERSLPNPDLRKALGVMARGIDSAWLTLGAVASYLALVRVEGLAAARRWGLLLVGGSLAIGLSSVLWGLPLGPIHFSSNLGWKLGLLPIGWPFLWFSVVVGAREVVLRALPRLSHSLVALLTGFLCMAFDVLMEPVAWKYRAWWLWYPARLDAPVMPPLTAYATWLVAGAAFAFLMRSPHIVPRVRVRPLSPLFVFGAVVLAAFVGKVVLG
jgi:hypothetical protein